MDLTKLDKLKEKLQQRSSGFEAGKMFIRYSWDLIGDIADFEKIIVFGEL